MDVKAENVSIAIFQEKKREHEQDREQDQRTIIHSVSRNFKARLKKKQQQQDKQPVLLCMS